MQFEMKRSLTGGQSADPDPIADPTDVPSRALMKIPLSLRNSDTIPGGLVFTLEGTAAQAASVEVWTQDDTGEDRLASMPDIPTDAEKLSREFYQATAAAIVVTVDELTKLPPTDVMPGPGTIYIRVTAVPAADAVLKVAAVN